MIVCTMYICHIYRKKKFVGYTGPQEAFLWWGRERDAQEKCQPPWLANEEKLGQYALKQSPKKQNLNQNINVSKYHIWNSFWKIFRAYNFFIFVNSFQWTLSEFLLISDFLVESLKANKKQRKRSLILRYSFAQEISFISRTLIYLTFKIICSGNTAKNLSQLTNFPANLFLFSVGKNICTAPFIEAQEFNS